MRKLYSGILAATIGMFCAMPLVSTAQGGPNYTDSDKRTKTVRGCVYEVLPGLAEITSVKVSRKANKSVLKYDEHEVLFTFTPMEGGELLEMLKDSEIEFVLRNRATRIPVGPEYIKRKKLKVGTKYAMNLLQARNQEACLEQYTYESKILDNDLFEAEENIIPFIKEAYAEEYAKKEADFIRKKESKKTVTTTPEPSPEDEFANNFSIQAIAAKEGVDLSLMTEAELRDYIIIKMDQFKANDGFIQTAMLNNDGIDKEGIRAEVEEKIREKYEAQLTSSTTTTAAATTKANSKKIQAEALRKARKAARDKAREEKLAAKRKAKEERERQAEIARIRAEIEAEEEAKILAEIEAAKKAAAAKRALEKQEKATKRQKKEAAMAKLHQIEKELIERITTQANRKKCVFGTRIAGTIEVVKVRKVKNADESHLKYAEYEVLVQFRPDNYAELSKKDKKQWDETLYPFTLDPTGVNANPGAGYIRKYKVFKASKYQGFVQQLESGICNAVMLYSPDLPIDAAKMKLK